MKVHSGTSEYIDIDPGPCCTLIVSLGALLTTDYIELEPRTLGNSEVTLSIRP